ncbi:hypothetical protein [Sulfurimonas gotlandica]|uniref:hypothetical protein n=1 Tax=Sulfurimonas gotlandica TaxID=1176482 RepID=UPI001F526B79|nr:hypothetical protein [Sulfurimonas gotlandica]
MAFYTVDYRIHTWDEVIYYFNRITRFIELGFLNYHDGIESTFSKIDFNIFPFLFNSIIYFIFGFNWFPIIINIILGLILLYLFYYIAKEVFRFETNFAIALSLLMLITFGYGPTTYIMIKPLFIDLNNQWFLPPIARQESPSTVLFILLSYFIILYNYVYKERNFFLIPLIIITFINNFSYPYYILYTLTFVSFMLVYIFYFERSYLKRFLVAIFFNYLFFLLWFILGKIYVSHDSDFIYTLIFDRSLDVKTLLINGIFIFIHFVNIVYNKNINNNISKIFIIMLLAGIVSYHFNVVLGYKIENWHIDIYVLKPLQWISLIFWSYQVLFIRNNASLIIFIITAIFLLSNYNYSNTYIKNKNTYLTKQIDIYNSYNNISAYVKAKEVLSLDPLFIMAGSTITNHYNYITFSGREIQIDIERNLDKYILSSLLHDINKVNTFENINRINFGFIEGHKNYEPLKYIIFLNDQVDEIYQSLDKYGSNIQEKDLKDLIFKRFDELLDSKNNYKGYILLNKNQFKNIIVLKDSKIIYEDHNIILYYKG